MKKAILWLILLLTVAALCVILFMPGPRFKDVIPDLPALQDLPDLPGNTEPPHAEIELIGDKEVVLEYGQDYTDPGASSLRRSIPGSSAPRRSATASSLTAKRSPASAGP